MHGHLQAKPPLELAHQWFSFPVLTPRLPGVLLEQHIPPSNTLGFVGQGNENFLTISKTGDSISFALPAQAGKRCEGWVDGSQSQSQF